MRQRVASWIWECDLVSMDWAGSLKRPVIRLRIEQSPMGDPPVTVDDCARVSRALEGWLDEHDEIPERYVLEVSSPGVRAAADAATGLGAICGRVGRRCGLRRARGALLPARGGVVGVGPGARTDGLDSGWEMVQR